MHTITGSVTCLLLRQFGGYNSTRIIITLQSFSYYPRALERILRWRRCFYGGCCARTTRRPTLRASGPGGTARPRRRPWSPATPWEMSRRWWCDPLGWWKMRSADERFREPSCIGCTPPTSAGNNLQIDWNNTIQVHSSNLIFRQIYVRTWITN